MGCPVETPEMVNNYSHSNFQDDLRRVMLATGTRGKPCIFLLCDTQVTDEKYLEDINNILGCGDIPGLFNDEEEADIEIKMRKVAAERNLPETPEACRSLFVQQVRDFFHVILCMSPVGNDLRTRVRHFPNLISCTTIDWFEAWPTSALMSVSKRFIVGSELQKYSNKKQDPDGERMRKSLCETCVIIHETVQQAAEDLMRKLKRRVFATPKSYVDMVTLYLKMLREKRSALEKRVKSMSDGIGKLEETNDTVVKLQRELSLMQPDLERKAKGATELLKHVEQEQNKATAVQAKVSQDEANVAKRQAEVLALQMDAKRDLTKAMPAYQTAVKALESLEKKDIIEIRSFVKPPMIVQTVMEAVCILLEEQPTWESARKILNRPTYMEDLANFDKDNISTKTVAKLSKYIENPEMQPESVKRVSVAAGGMCMWVHAMNVYSQVASEVAPKQERLEKMNSELNAANRELTEKQQELSDCMEEVASLQKKCDDTLNEKNRLAIEVERCSQRLLRAEKLKHSLEDERVRWVETVAILNGQMKNIVGDVFLGVATISYLGPFVPDYRKDLITRWKAEVDAKRIPCTERYSFVKSLGDPPTVRDWRINGLPSDDFSTESGIIATKSSRWPLMIDPQNQASQWIKGFEGRKMTVISVKNDRLMTVVERCVSGGLPLLIEDIGESIDPVLDNILYKRYYRSGGKKMIALGDRILEYSEEFRLYLTTNFRNPKYLPDVFIRTTVLNFTVTDTGLEEQLLGDVVKIENPDLEGRYTNLIVSISCDKKQLQIIEDNILHDLHNSKGHLLDNEKLINALAESKMMSAMVTERLAESESAEVEILSLRENYRPIAIRGSCMYFLVANLVQLDTMYSYSLEYFKELFCNCIKECPPSPNLEVRMKVLAEKTTLTIHRNVTRGLFDRHRLLFTFLLCSEVLALENPAEKVSELEWSLLMGTGETARGRVDSYLEKWKNPDEEVLGGDIWEKICLYVKSMRDSFEGFLSHITNNWEDWKAWITSENMHMKKMPENWDDKLSGFQRLILVRCVRPEFGLVAVRNFVERKLGKEFVQSNRRVDFMERLYENMDNKTPCLFLLSSGTDPMNNWLKLAEKKGVKDVARSISLGQGQGKKATALIENGKRGGYWVLLQNIHLAKSFMDDLDRIVLSLRENPEEISSNFRLFLTSLPVDYIPARILQASVKLTTEPERGIKSNVTRTLEMNVDHDMLDDAEHVKGDADRVWKKLLYSLCMFHAVVVERRKFGSIGWNVQYSFSDSDFTTALATLKLMLGDAFEGGIGKRGDVPLDSLVFVTGHIIYGGRITDGWDRRCLMSLMRVFFNADVLKSGYSFIRNGSMKEMKVRSGFFLFLVYFLCLCTNALLLVKLTHDDRRPALVALAPLHYARRRSHQQRMRILAVS